MAKFTRQTLTRGTRLVRQAVITPLQSIATALANATLNRDNLDTSYAPFRVNLHVPAVDSELFKAWTKAGETSLCIPFVLPPLQETFDSTGKLQSDTPTPILDEFSFSFDQRSESALITDRHNAAIADAGRLDYDSDFTNYDAKISLFEKKQWFFDNTQSLVPDREVFSVSVPGLAYQSAIDRVNPFVLSNLNKPINPYRTYLLVVEVPKLYTATETHALPALQFSFRFRYPLVSRDTAATVQNLPNSVLNLGSYPIFNPPGASIIEESSIHGNLKVLDNALSNKLQGGWNQDSSTPRTEQLQTESCYTVYCIPMWANFGSRRLTSNETNLIGNLGSLILNAPYKGNDYWDRVQIPITRPFTLHHAIVCLNQCGPATATFSKSEAPTSATFAHKVGLGILCGPFGDEFTYSQLAQQDYTVAGKPGRRIDKINPSSNQLMIAGGAANEGCWDILSLPLLPGATNGTGYYAQGHPIYIGRSTNQTLRSTLNGAPPNTLGKETHLEIRWRIEDTVGLASVGAVTPGAAGTANETYVGYGGHWVILIGKTPLTNPGWDSSDGLLM